LEVGGRKVTIVFCQSRAGNDEFFKWLYGSYLTDFVQQIRCHCELAPDSKAWFQLDGEQKQIKPFINDEMIAKMEENHIVVGKLPASCTAVMQPADRWKIFSSMKGVKIDPSHLTNDEHALKKCKETIQRHIDRFSNHDIAPHQKSKLPAALLESYYRWKRTMNCEIVKVSFKLTGIYPFCIWAMHSQCTSFESYKHLMNDIVSQKIAFRNAFELEGYLSDALIHKCVPGLTRPEKNRDKLSTTHKRACILNHKSFVLYEKDKQQQKQAAVEAKAIKKRRDSVPNMTTPATKKSRKSSTPTTIAHG